MSNSFFRYAQRPFRFFLPPLPKGGFLTHHCHGANDYSPLRLPSRKPYPRDIVSDAYSWLPASLKEQTRSVSSGTAIPSMPQPAAPGIG